MTYTTEDPFKSCFDKWESFVLELSGPIDLLTIKIGGYPPYSGYVKLHYKHCCLLMLQGVVQYIIIVILYLHFFFVIKLQ
jgi:hypothetical protein